MKNKKFKIPVLLILPLVLVCILAIMYAVLQLVIAHPEWTEANYVMFHSVEECQQIEEITSTDVKCVQTYTADQDKKLKGLSYAAFFGGEFETADFSFEIFAYEFEDADAAKQYFANHTGKSLDLLGDASFTASSGIGGSSLVIFQGHNAYVIFTGVGDLKNVEALLAEVFSAELEF